VKVLALRGATTVDENTKAEVDTKTQHLVEEMLERNAIAHDDLVSIIFTATDDITAEFPATAARALGLGDVPLLCARELAIEHGKPLTIRVMMHFYGAQARNELHHVYLEGARSLRDDLPA
jgi:chorismate mutase